MNILTDEDLTAIYKRANNIGDGKNPPISTKFIFAAMRAMRSETISLLAAGVSVEPYATLHHDDGYFTTKQREHDLRYSGPMRTEVVTLDQLTTAIAAARVQENERCAEELDGMKCNNKTATSAIKQCAEAIRALLGKEST